MSTAAADDPLRDVDLARVEMIAALADLTSSYQRCGGDVARVHEVHGRFFDANVAMKDALGRAGYRLSHDRPAPSQT